MESDEGKLYRKGMAAQQSADIVSGVLSLSAKPLIEQRKKGNFLQIEVPDDDPSILDEPKSTGKFVDPRYSPRYGMNSPR